MLEQGWQQGHQPCLGPHGGKPLCSLQPWVLIKVLYLNRGLILSFSWWKIISVLTGRIWLSEGEGLILLLCALCLVTLEDAQNSPTSELYLPNLVESHEVTGVTGRRICPSSFKNNRIFFNGIFLGAAQECAAQTRCC